MSVGVGCDTGKLTNLLFLVYKPSNYKILWTLSSNLLIGLLKIMTPPKNARFVEMIFLKIQTLFVAWGPWRLPLLAALFLCDSSVLLTKQSES